MNNPHDSSFFFVSEPPEIIKATEPDRTLDRICHEFDDFVTEKERQRKYLIHGFSTLRRENKAQVAGPSRVTAASVLEPQLPPIPQPHQIKCVTMNNYKSNVFIMAIQQISPLSSHPPLINVSHVARCGQIVFDENAKEHTDTQMRDKHASQSSAFLSNVDFMSSL